MYPITEIIYKSGESCNHKWLPRNEIGTDGTYGEVWSACCESNCNHALKYMPFNDGVRINTREDIINEINVQNACAVYNLCPTIQDAWISPNGGVMVMNLYKMTAKQLLLQFDNILDRIQILANIITLLDKLHRIGVYHGDLHLDNIMVDYQPYDDITNTSKYIDTNYRYSFIDFGKGGRFTNMDDKHIYDDYVEVAAHLRDLCDEYEGFDELYKHMVIYMKKFDK